MVCRLFLELYKVFNYVWKTDRQNIHSVADKVAEYLKETNQWRTYSPPQINPDLLEQAAKSLIEFYDWQNGGWGRAPKFPQPMVIEFLLHRHLRNQPEALQVARHALDVMQKGGLWDVVGGGFHRYSTDSRWLVPHFEKCFMTTPCWLKFIFMPISLLVILPIVIPANEH